MELDRMEMELQVEKEKFVMEEGESEEALTQITNECLEEAGISKPEKAVNLEENKFEICCIKCSRLEEIPIFSNLFGKDKHGKSMFDEITSRGWVLTKIIDKEGYMCPLCR